MLRRLSAAIRRPPITSDRDLTCRVPPQSRPRRASTSFRFYIFRPCREIHASIINEWLALAFSQLNFKQASLFEERSIRLVYTLKSSSSSPFSSAKLSLGRSTSMLSTSAGPNVPNTSFSSTSATPGGRHMVFKVIQTHALIEKPSNQDI